MWFYCNNEENTEQSHLCAWTDVHKETWRWVRNAKRPNTLNFAVIDRPIRTRKVFLVYILLWNHLDISLYTSYFNNKSNSKLSTGIAHNWLSESVKTAFTKRWFFSLMLTLHRNDKNIFKTYRLLLCLNNVMATNKHVVCPKSGNINSWHICGE